jgi:hypothetical protein
MMYSEKVNKYIYRGIYRSPSSGEKATGEGPFINMGALDPGFPDRER